MSPLVILGRLLLAGVCSGLIGFERETARKAAGLRTHTLVGIGAAIFSTASIISFDAPDQSRIAAQIVTGVGFLGAGAIFREGAFVSGLTTAAGLWVSAALGMASAAGSYWLAIIGTSVALTTLYGLRAIDGAVARRKHRAPSRLEVHIADAEKVQSVLKFLHRVNETSEQLDFKLNPDGTGVMVVTCDVSEVSMMRELLAAHKAVTSVEELSPLYWQGSST